jgi:hypothetical protein
VQHFRSQSLRPSTFGSKLLCNACGTGLGVKAESSACSHTVVMCSQCDMQLCTPFNMPFGSVQCVQSTGAEIQRSFGLVRQVHLQRRKIGVGYPGSMHTVATWASMHEVIRFRHSPSKSLTSITYPFPVRGLPGNSRDISFERSQHAALQYAVRQSHQVPTRSRTISILRGWLDATKTRRVPAKNFPTPPSCRAAHDATSLLQARLRTPRTPRMVRRHTEPLPNAYARAGVRIAWLVSHL